MELFGNYETHRAQKVFETIKFFNTKMVSGYTIGAFFVAFSGIYSYGHLNTYFFLRKFANNKSL